jgi:transposase
MMLKTESCPQRLLPARRATQLDQFVEHLSKRWAEGCHNAAALTREIQEQGYRGSESRVRKYVKQWRRQLPDELQRKRRGPGGMVAANLGNCKVTPSARRTAWIILRSERKLEKKEQIYLKALLEMSPAVGKMQELAQEFSEMIKTRDERSFDEWLKKAKGSGIAEMKNFAKGLEADKQAVEAALRYEWSNGQTEGQVNRVKMIKRQMYGRAKFDLLRARVLKAA